MPTPKCQFLDFLFRRHAHELRVFAGRRAGTEAVDDLIQETYLRLLQHPEPQFLRNPRAFLYRTLSNLAADRYRRQRVRDAVHSVTENSEVAAATVADSAATPEQRWALLDNLEALNRALMELPDLTAYVFVLYRLEGLTHREIALRLRISESASQRHLRLAADHLLSRYEPD